MLYARKRNIVKPLYGDRTVEKRMFEKEKTPLGIRPRGVCDVPYAVRGCAR
jgi:hypothetical protein